jgi:hypothetical protein
MDPPIRDIGDSKRMRAQFAKICPFILLHHLSVVQMGQSPKRINSDQDIPGISLVYE